MIKTVVFGAAGQLGQCLKSLTDIKGDNSVYYPSKGEADILDCAGLRNLFSTYRPDYIVNCAAYTAVDKAEDEPEAAAKINKDGIENIAKICAVYGTTLIHISTDFVFSGEKSSPLQEADVTEPISVYGQTKLEGEKVVEELAYKRFIIRTGWLYSEFGNNFVKTMLKLGSERDELKIIADQAGTPTYAVDLARVILNIIDSKSSAYGTYHYGNEGITSWYDFAKAIFEISGTPVKAIPVKTEEYVTRAKRPPYSVLDKSKIKKEVNLTIPYWRDSLVTCMGKIKQQITA